MKIIILSILCILSGVVKGEHIILALSGRDFHNSAFGGPPDPFIKVRYAVGPSDYTLVGQTSIVHSKDPVWSEAFQFDYVEELNQHLQFEVLEHDPLGNDHYGMVNVTMTEVFQAPDNIFERDFGKGILIVTVTKV